MKDLDDLVQAFEKETTASGQRSILAKIQHGLIAAQDIGDDKLVTVQAMSDLIENKSRQLEHDSKILDFGKDDEEDGGQIAGGGGGVTGTSSSKTSQNNANNLTSSNVTSTKANQGSGSGNKSSKAEKAEKEGGKPPIKRRKKQQQPSADNNPLLRCLIQASEGRRRLYSLGIPPLQLKPFLRQRREGGRPSRIPLATANDAGAVQIDISPMH